MSRDFKAGPRARANNFFDVGVVGRRTGITMKANIKKDADGLDNIDDFWDDDNDGNQPNNEPSDQEEYSDNDDGAREMSPQTRRRQQQAHGYVEQELPQELLSTPTSRRSRNVPMSKGSTSGLSNSVGGLSLLPNESMYDNAEEYQSPSFHAVKKRLVFTNDSSDIEPDQQDFAQDEYQDQEEEEFHQAPLRQTARLAPQPKNIATHRATGSPALDRLLNASRKKSAQIKAITAMGSPLSSLPISRTAIFPTTFMASRRVGTEAGRPKAFDFGSYGGNFDGEDDLSNGGDGDVDDSELPQRHEPITLPTKPTTAVATSMKTTTAPRMPSGFKRKGRSATARRAEPSDEDDGDVDDVDDDQIYHESESQYADDDRLQFSDEDQEVAYRKPVHEKEEEEEGEEEEEEEEEKEEDEEEDEEEDLAAPARKPQRKTKNVAQEQKVKTAGRSRKAVPDIIPKAKPIVATTSKKTSRSARGDDGVASALDESEEDNDDSQVPSFTHKASLKNRARNDEPSSDSRAKRKMTASANTEVRRREGRVELIEVPVVPDAGPEDSGVRRSHRTKIAPLEFWKNERLVLGKDEHNSAPVIKAVLRAEHAAPPTKKRRRAPRPAQTQQQRRNQTKKQTPSLGEVDWDRGQQEVEENQFADSEDEKEAEQELKRDRKALKNKAKEVLTSKTAEVLVFGTDQVASRAIAEARDSIRYKDVEGGRYQFHRGLEDADSLSSGTIKIMPGGSKPYSRGQGNNFSMVFYVVRGLVEVTVHKTEFVLSTGGRFMVPRRNEYGIVNLSKKSESVLFFVQTKAIDYKRIETPNNDKAATLNGGEEVTEQEDDVAQTDSREEQEGEAEAAMATSSTSKAGGSSRKGELTPKRRLSRRKSGGASRVG